MGFFRDLAFFFSILLMVIKAKNTVSLEGQNVCSVTISFTNNYRQSYQVSYRHRSTYKCGFWNLGRCTRYRTVYKTNYRTATRISYKKQNKCCKGWTQVGNQCIRAICTQPCVNGTCTKPNYCSCNTGYYGLQCDTGCPPGKWGPHCRHDCHCQNNATCSSHTGNCTCTPGWKGHYCNETCGQGYFGNECENNCTCLNGATCDPVTGTCFCASGFRGQRCESQCFPGWHGKNCANTCACKNGATCDLVTGTCSCTAGWTGNSCSQKCPKGTYGYGCAQTCIHCMNGASCNHVTGLCQCLPGYTGERCELLCRKGTYGHGCQEICACYNNSTCSRINGSCACNPGYTGKHCDHLIENELVFLKEKQTDDTNPLIPTIAACLPVLLIASVVFGVIFFRKKKKAHRKQTENTRPAEPIYASTEVQPTGPVKEEATESASGTTESNDDQEAEKIHVYQTPTTRTLTAVNVNNVSYVAMGAHYMDLSNQRSLEANYQPLSSKTQKKNNIKPSIYDIPVKKTTNVYEEIKLDKDSSEKRHYYKGLELAEAKRKDDVSYVAKGDETAEQIRVGMVENEYESPLDSGFVKINKSGGEGSVYATPD